jgi:hypothetical protein
MAPWNEPYGTFTNRNLDEEHRQRQAEERRRNQNFMDWHRFEQKLEHERSQRRQRDAFRAPAVSGVPIQPVGKKKEWSNLFAILGFLGAAGAIYAETQPALGGALVGGVIAAYVAGRFYKLLLVIGLGWFVWQMLSNGTA